MKMKLVQLGAFAALALALAAQAPTLNLPAGTRLQAELKTTLDSSKATVGEPVKAQTTSNLKLNGQTILPKGSELLGAVTLVVPAESKKSPSRLGVRFDQVVLKKTKQTVPLSAAIINVEMINPAMAMDNMPMDMPTARPMEQPAEGTAGAPQSRGDLGSQPVPGEVTGQNPEIGAMSQASHAQTIRILKPTPSQGSVLTSSQGNLKLQSGIHIDLVTLPPHP